MFEVDELEYGYTSKGDKYEMEKIGLLSPDEAMPFCFASLFNWVTVKGKEYAPFGANIFSVKSRPLLEGLLVQGSK